MGQGIVIVWEFFVREGCEGEFETVYGAHGDWALLFARSEDYLGTELLRDASAPRRYLTLDRWTTAASFEQLWKSCSAEYAALDARCEAWTEKESKLGVWTVP